MHRIMTVAILIIFAMPAILPQLGIVTLAQGGEQWATYVDSRYGFSIHHPASWQPEIRPTSSRQIPGVIVQRLVFMGQEAGVIVDLFPNPTAMDLESWYQAYQARYVPVNGIVERGLSVAGVEALYTLDPGDSQNPPRHSLMVTSRGLVYRIEYLASDGGGYLGIYRAMLESLALVGTADTTDELFDLTSVPLTWSAPLVQTCCGYTDPNYNPYDCQGGNCVWWAKYKRPDTGGQQYPWWGNASNWPSRAIEEGFTVNNTPATGSIACWVSQNHVAYVESFVGGTVYYSDMDWGGDCGIDYWQSTDWSGVQFIHPRCHCCTKLKTAGKQNPSFAAESFSCRPLLACTSAPAQPAVQPVAAALLPEPTATAQPTVVLRPTAVPEPTDIPGSVQTDDPLIPSQASSHYEPVEPQRTPPASENYRIPKSVFGSGGGEKTSTHYVMNSTQGQSTDLERRESASYVLIPGYWGRWVPITYDHAIYLPLVLRNY